jgi:hypothetical protein
VVVGRPVWISHPGNPVHSLLLHVACHPHRHLRCREIECGSSSHHSIPHREGVLTTRCPLLAAHYCSPANTYPPPLSPHGMDSLLTHHPSLLTVAYWLTPTHHSGLNQHSPSPAHY